MRAEFGYHHLTIMFRRWSKLNCIVNQKGELLEILQEEKELEEGKSLVPLSNYYDVLNLERYDIAIWDFELKKWIGKGEQRPIPEPQIKLYLEDYILDLEFRLSMLEMGGV